jgi:hypothetical protein
MKKSLVIFSALMLCSALIFAQNQGNTGKNGKKIINSTERLNNTTKQVAEQTTQTTGNVQAISENVKGIVRVFQPFFIHIKKQSQTTIGNGEIEGSGTMTVEMTESNQTSDGTQNQMPNNSAMTTPNNSEMGGMSNTGAMGGMPNNGGMPSGNTIPSGNYNTDGSANLGTQNHASYGNYLDMGKGEIMDDISVAGASQNVDLIFTATSYGGKTLYAFFSPYYAKSSTQARLYNYGIKFKRNDPHPASTWDNVNESEVAVTTLTGAQFDKIQTNPQIESVVKQTARFNGVLEIRDGNAAGKVLAIKTLMNNRTCYGLLYIVEQFGTTGTNSFLKVKLKVTGFDSNGDGNPDANMYQH